MLQVLTRITGERFNLIVLELCSPSTIFPKLPDRVTIHKSFVFVNNFSCFSSEKCPAALTQKVNVLCIYCRNFVLLSAKARVHVISA